MKSLISALFRHVYAEVVKQLNDVIGNGRETKLQWRFTETRQRNISLNGVVRRQQKTFVVQWSDYKTTY